MSLSKVLTVLIPVFPVADSGSVGSSRRSSGLPVHDRIQTLEESHVEDQDADDPDDQDHDHLHHGQISYLVLAFAPVVGRAQTRSTDI